MGCTKGMRACRSGCLHRALVEEYWAARDAVLEARENGDNMRMEDDEYKEAHPTPQFKDWLIEHKQPPQVAVLEEDGSRPARHHGQGDQGDVG